ncbi:MAG: hypothetical protein H0W73_08995 [Bacteroidetes bacterium]|nr:hypothetical protein [Bacteroidota bacterium]
MKKLLSIVALAAGIFLTSCTNINKSMREPNTRLNLEKKDFTLSDQVTGEATSTKIIGIDFKRLFLKETGTHVNDNASSVLPFSLASIPVLGGIIVDATAGYALHDMMQKNPGFDVVFYPQYETTVKRPIGLGFIYKVTTVKATARLGKLNK